MIYIKIFKCNNTLDTYRAIELEDRMVFTQSELGHFMYEDGLLYEVEFGGYEIEPYINAYWNKVGKVYTLNEFQELVNNI